MVVPILTRNDYIYFYGSEAIQRIPDSKKQSDVIEFLLAKTMVVRALGENWWNAAQTEIDAFVKGSRLHRPATHPLTRFATEFGQKEVSTRTSGLLLAFAADLLIVADQKRSGLESKIPELQMASSFSQFSQAWFEVHVASSCVRNGMEVRFLRESKRERRPDFVAKFRGIELIVECKARRELDLEERKSERTYLKNLPKRLSAAENLLSDACGKAVPKDAPYLVAMKIDRPSFPIFSLELKQLGNCVETIMIRNAHVSSVVLFSSVILEDETGVSFGDHIIIIPNLIPEVPLPSGLTEALTEAKPPRENILTSYALKH